VDFAISKPSPCGLREDVQMRERLKIAAKFEDAVRALLHTPPPPSPIKGSRAKSKKKRARKASKKR